jgi:tripartite-type tricarboxylate transporter receptor subunit TctC
MKLPRRQVLRLAAAAAAAAMPAISSFASAQTYPTRPVHWIVPYPPGGPTDIVARVMAQYLSERLHQSFVVENRAGASGNVGTEDVVRAPPEGYTLLLVGAFDAINATLYEKLNFNFIRDIEPVAGIIRVPLVMEVNPSVPAKTVPDFIVYAKENPGKINYASPGSGTPQHASAELFKSMTGINMIHVPYRGIAPALTDLLAGQVQVMFDTTPASIQHIQSGKLRALAVTTTTRAEALPDLPTVGDFVPGYESSAWYGVGVPRNTPAEIIDELNREINVGLADPLIKAKFAALGATVLPGSPSDFRKIIISETEKWAKVVKFAGMKVE